MVSLVKIEFSEEIVSMVSTLFTSGCHKGYTSIFETASSKDLS